MSEQTLPVDYANEIRNILEQPLTPRVIEHYAKTALDNLTAFVTRVTVDYESQQIAQHGSGAETEDAALAHFGLPDVKGALDHIGDTAERIKALDMVVNTVRPVDTVITPPEPEEPIEKRPRGTSYEPPEVLPRLKTVLFILSNDFKIDVYKPGEIKLELGVVHEGMRRRHGYYMLKIPALNRTILVCDEMDNATYVFANDKRDDLGLIDEKLKGLTKPELDEHIEAFPDLGVRIVYSDAYVPNVTNALRDIENYTPVTNGQAGQSYLVPNAPPGNMSVESFAREVGVSKVRIREEVISAVRDTLGKIALYRHGAHVTDSISPDQQGTLLDELDRQGLLVELPSEEYPQISRDAMEALFGVNRDRIDRAIDDLNDQLGPRQRYKFHTRRDEGFDPWQQNMVYDWLWEHKYVRPQPRETILSVTGMGKLFKLTDRVINHAITDLGDTIGVTPDYKFVSQVSPGFEPWQQNMVYDWLNAEHMFAPDAPDNIWSRKRMREEWGIHSRILIRALGNLEAVLGEKKYYRFNGRPAIGYDENDRVLIRHEAEAQRRFPRNDA